MEYQNDNLTGNHIVNNARALIFAGHCAKDPKLVLLGRSILEENLPILLKSGFLREGSSHSQFLFTRWLLEIMFIVCECKDNKTLNVIKPFVEEALLACDFFRINNKNNFEIPKFGDISPDQT